MKFPRKTNRYCPYCRKKAEHKISELSTGHKRGAMKRGSIERAKLRGLGRGIGNKGKWGSKPPITKWKRKTKATTKKVLLYTCQVCKKTHQKKKGIRTSKLQLEDKKK